MNNKQALNIIYNNLKNGTQYGKFSYWNYYYNSPLPFPYFNIVLYKHYCKNIFCWQHFGSSANKATKEQLAWIIKNIFKTSPEKFLLEYTTKEEYDRMMIAIKENIKRENETQIITEQTEQNPF